jgi:hypothetical protein
MEIDRGWPVIQPADHPITIYNALRDNNQSWRDNRNPIESEAWIAKTRLDASETVSDGFAIVGEEVWRPDGCARIYVRPEQLEFSLVAHGCRLLEEGTPANQQEVEKIDSLLAEVDRITGRHKEQFQRLADLVGRLYLQRINLSPPNLPS